MSDIITVSALAMLAVILIVGALMFADSGPRQRGSLIVVFEPVPEKARRELKICCNDERACSQLGERQIIVICEKDSPLEELAGEYKGVRCMSAEEAGELIRRLSLGKGECENGKAGKDPGRGGQHRL